MNERENNKRGIFYGVIGVATLVVAVIGATFAYFTASDVVENSITGNMATIQFDLNIEKVTMADEVNGGMIPLSNTMVEAAIEGANNGNKTDAAKYTAEEIEALPDAEQTGLEAGVSYKDPQICVDDNGNAVCQIYKISVVNGGTAGMYLDGYVTLTGGSGIPKDVTAWTNVGADVTPTTMRWAQAFCTGTDNKLTSCTTKGVTTTGASSKADGGTDNSGFGTNDWAAIDLTETAVNNTSGLNTGQIVLTSATATNLDAVTAKGTFAGGTNQYDIIDKNYIRISDRSATATSYNRQTDVTSALVYNQFIAPMAGDDKVNVGDSFDSTTSAATPDAKVFYIVVWLSENGRNQNANTVTNPNTETGVPTDGDGFFSGAVTFISAQGSEVTASFSGFTAVPSQS